jgi:hypothetical protein
MSDWWTEYPWRQIQTNLREIDMRDIRAEQVVADLKSFKATVLMINAAGIIASYPTRLPFHFQSPCLTGDSLERIINACHTAGIRVIARTDFSKVRRPIHEQHPEWAYRTAAGEIVDYNGDVHVCLNSAYQQERALEIIEECLTMLPFDGIFFNMGGYITRDYSGNSYGPCHCENCRRRFREMYGLDLPMSEDTEDLVFPKYSQFKMITQREHQEKVYRFIQAIRPDICIANHRAARRGFIRQESNTAMDRPLPHWQYDASANTKWAVSSYPEMVSSNATVDFIDFPYRHVAVSAHQQKLRLVQSLANGGALDYYLIGRLDNHEDRSGFGPVREIFHYHAANEQAYMNLRSLADVALMNSSNTGEFRGWFRILLENHFLFDTLLPDAAMDVSWDRYRAMILPDLQAISDRLAARIDAFVEAGGTLIASGRTGFSSTWNEPRAAPALRCLGVKRVREVRQNTRSCYLKLDEKHDFARFADVDLVYLDGPYIDAEYTRGIERRLRLIPPHHFGPPERCYYTTVSDDPGLLVNRFGRGRCIYIPWLPGALFHRQGHTNTADFATDVLQHIAGLSPIGGDLPPQIEITLFEQLNTTHRLLHLVNTSGHFGNTFYPPVVMRDLTIELPCPTQPRAVQSLPARRPVEHNWSSGRLAIQVPRLELFDAIEIRQDTTPA